MRLGSKFVIETSRMVILSNCLMLSLSLTSSHVKMRLTFQIKVYNAKGKQLSNAGLDSLACKPSLFKIKFLFNYQNYPLISKISIQC